MSRTYDLTEAEKLRPFSWSWFDGADDCEPPEPEKEWIAILDCDGEEVATIVLRKGCEQYRAEREERAAWIVAALNGEER